MDMFTDTSLALRVLKGKFIKKQTKKKKICHLHTLKSFEDILKNV